jgi:hypothetical protein
MVNKPNMTTYDPENDLPADEWLALSESERIDAVETYHQRQRIRLPNARLHAATHAVVENQIALGESAVVETLARLRSEGLTRHEAVHAIGAVVVDQIVDVLKNGPGANTDLSRPYLDRVRRLTAAEWRQSGQTET